MEKRKQKKIVWLALGLMVLVIFVYLAVRWIPQRLATKPQETTPPDFDFYPADYTEDIFMDEDYLELDRAVSYRSANVTVTINDRNYREYGDDVVLLAAYIDAVIAGDSEGYNALFTQRYLQENGAKQPFTMQRVYDILVEKLDTSGTGNTAEYFYYVSYKIMKNNGSFRQDIDSDSSRTLLFHLVTENGVLKIDSMTHSVYA